MNNYYEIWQEINICYDRIYFLQFQNNKLENKLNELYELKQNYNMVENRYNEYNYQKNIQAKKIRETIPNFKFAKRLSESLIETINGKESKKAVQSICLMQNKITRKVENIQDEISDNKREINYLKNKVSELEYQLRIINFNM